MITASIVLFKQTYAEIESLLNGLNQSGINTLFIIDNSPFNAIEEKIKVNHPNIQYIHQADNPGFGAAHNIAIKKAMSLGSRYHFVVNPDVHLKDHVVMSLVDFLENNDEVGMVMPQILNTDGTIQYLPKFLPTPISFYKRILYRKFNVFKSFITKYELRDIASNLIYDTPVISGCFTLFRVSALQEIGLYDDRFFMYLEDWDISRRMNVKYRTVYYPKVAVVHGYAAGSSKSYGLFKVHISSIRAYFRKWGWFFDSERARLNERTRKQFK